MRLSTRKVLDRAFTLLGMVSIVLMGLSLLVILVPIMTRGIAAVCFRATIEHRRLLSQQFQHGDPDAVAAEVAKAHAAAQPVFDALTAFEKQDLPNFRGRKKREMRDDLAVVKEALRHLLGPLPGEPNPVLIRDQYGATRWDKAKKAKHDVLFEETWEYPVDEQGNPLPGKKVYVPRRKRFEGTALAGMFDYIDSHLAEMMRPRLTFYWRFFVDESKDAHFFGGIWPELLGTFYLTLGAMLFAIPVGVLSAVYLVEYARQGALISLIRTCISTLAGVPSIVFGLFGLAFFINSIHVSDSKSVLAGSMTLSILVLPTVIRASEEALKSVPVSYKEAALSLGAGKWRTILTVIIPAALPGILTGIVISMGRAAGETAPIIFTAAVSVGRPLNVMQVFSEPTPALSWNIYNLATEHEAVDQIRHVQYGMVMTLVVLVLLLNLAAVVLRARISRKLKG
jgi:phosphate transport system permease protein